MKTKSKVPAKPPASQRSRPSTPPAPRGRAANDRSEEKHPTPRQRRVAPVDATASDEVARETSIAARPQAGGGAPERDEQLARLIAEIQVGRMGCLRTAKALAEFAKETGAKLRQARILVGDSKTFVSWLPRTLGGTRARLLPCFISPGYRRSMPRLAARCHWAKPWSWSPDCATNTSSGRKS